MATIKFKNGDEYALKLAKLGDRTDEICKKAIYPAARIVADQIKANLNAIPAEKFRRLHDGEKFSGLPESQKKDLADSFGITPIKLGEDGYYSAKIGFDGYGSISTKKYPNGIPNQLLARAAESGSSVREKTPFVRPAVNATKPQALDAMKKVVDEECQTTMKE